MGPVVRAMAAGIGLARESHLSSKARKQSKRDGSLDDADQKSPEIIVHPVSGDFLNSPDSIKEKKDGDPDLQDLSLHSSMSASDAELPLYGSWELDEAQDEVAEQDPEIVKSKVVGPGMVKQGDIPLLAEKFAKTYPIQAKTEMDRLNCSIIVPQRRPDARKRGFIRAYSPVLAAKNISEDCFLDFIDTFNAASQANPLLHAINLASFAANALPPGIGIAVAEAIRLAVDIGVELQSRYRTNDFLNKINKLFFLPRGLICFPMIWKPSVSSLVTSVAMDNTANAEASGLEEKTSTVGKFSGGAATTRGNVAFPDAAPLTFPLLDDLGDADDEKSRSVKQKMAGSMKFANEYLDRRAQATYAMKNPNSGLSNLGVRPEFRSRYSDPNHPAASGSLIGLITGGKISTHNLRQARRQNQQGGIRLPFAPGLSFGGTLFDSSAQSASTSVVDFMRDIKLSNVIRTARGKVSLRLCRDYADGKLTILAASALSCDCRCADSAGDRGSAAAVEGDGSDVRRICICEFFHDSLQCTLIANSRVPNSSISQH